jgi:hypothetical protein
MGRWLHIANLRGGMEAKTGGEAESFIATAFESDPASKAVAVAEEMRVGVLGAECMDLRTI